VLSAPRLFDQEIPTLAINTVGPYPFPPGVDCRGILGRVKDKPLRGVDTSLTRPPLSGALAQDRGVTDHGL